MGSLGIISEALQGNMIMIIGLLFMLSPVFVAIMAIIKSNNN